MDLQEIYKKESGYDVGIYNIDNTNYYSEDYVEWFEKKLRTLDVVGRSEQLICPECKLPFTKEELQIKEHCFNCGWEFVN